MIFHSIVSIFLLSLISASALDPERPPGCFNNVSCLSVSISDVNVFGLLDSSSVLSGLITLDVNVKSSNGETGRTFYVSVDGNNQNLGTYSTKAWSSFAGAKYVVGGLRAGDTICYLSGTYRNPNYGDGNVWKSSPDDAIISAVDLMGRKDAYITIRPCAGHRVKFEFDSAVAIRLSNSSFIRISGFEVEGYTQKLTIFDALKYQFAYRNAGETEILYRDPTATLAKALKGVEKTGTHNQNAITVGSACHHIDLFDLFIHDSTGHGIAAMGGVDYVNIFHNDFINTTWWSSNGNHAVSFKVLQSIDNNDDYKINVLGNYLRDCGSRLISWAVMKTAPVTMEIDEGKGLHCQDSTKSLGWSHGKVLFGDNVIIRQGNAGVTVNNAERVTFANNTMVDNGYLNVLKSQPNQVDPKLDEGSYVSVGGIRANGGKDCYVLNNLIVQRDITNAFDCESAATAANYVLKDNVYTGGIPAKVDYFNSPDQIKKASQSPLFMNPSIGDYTLSDSSLRAGTGFTVDLCISLSWPDATVKFEGSNSNCTSVVLNGLSKKPTKAFNINLGNLAARTPGDALKATVTIKGWWSTSSSALNVTKEVFQMP